MWWFAQSHLLVLFASLVRAAEIHTPLDCREPSPDRKEECSQPIDDIVAVVPGSSYVAKIECKDCPYVQQVGRDGASHLEHKILKADQVLLLNVTVSHDNRTVLLNGEPIYPLPTIPHPSHFEVVQYHTGFSHADLGNGLTCGILYRRTSNDGSDNHCRAWRDNIRLATTSTLRLDYRYTTEPSANHGEDKEAGAQYWEVTFDIIGGNSGYENELSWKFDHASQKMLQMLVGGKEVKKGHRKNAQDTKPASDLFGTDGEQEKTYEYHIVDMGLEPRTYTFPARKPLTVWGKVAQFFGNNVWETEGSRLVYLKEEWGWYGKKGTLRNMFGEFVHWDFWYLFWVILSATVGGLIVLFGIHKLFFWLKQQRELATWDGMDNVWNTLRQDPADEEADALLEGAYRDDPDDGGSSSPLPYTDEPLSMKPLPNKPLPEKPLPSIPLIDA